VMRDMQRDMQKDSKAGAEHAMPRNLRRLYGLMAAHHRSAPTDTMLSCIFAFNAGAINSGGFLAIGQYTSHMTGILASISDNLVLGATGAAFWALIGLITFCAGAAFAAFLINDLRGRLWGSQFAGPILLEALLILGFGAMGMFGRGSPAFIAVAAGLLCFIMGLQNATITKVTRARMRTTHITGILTDIGIRIGNGAAKPNHHLSSLSVLRLVFVMFFAGGLTGAIFFSALGYGFSIPLALFLMMIAAPPFVKSLQYRRKSRIKAS
jgi:uncharacterized membrane protein YoaK (UPF0700 family)